MGGALPQLRLLRLGHLPEPPPQRRRRGWRGSIVVAALLRLGTGTLDSTTPDSLVCGGGCCPHVKERVVPQCAPAAKIITWRNVTPKIILAVMRVNILGLIVWSYMISTL